jgi:RNA polymerase sigma-70 factor (ECF subfamily)
MADTPTSAESHTRQRSLLFLQFQPVLRGFIRSLVRDPAETEDLLQEVGAYVIGEGTAAPLVPEEFGAWCRVVARHRVLHHFRARRRFEDVSPERLIDLVDRAYAENAPSHEETGLRRRALERCLQGVTPTVREMLRLRYVEGRTAEDMGRLLRRSSAAVRMQLMRARSFLAQCLERRLRAAAEEPA